MDSDVKTAFHTRLEVVMSRVNQKDDRPFLWRRLEITASEKDTLFGEHLS